MAEFVVNKPIETTDPKIEVTVSSKEPLPVGITRFQLVVVDDSGNASEPNFVDVVILDTQRPTAILDAPRQVEVGQSFVLAGDRSSDIPPGKIEKYVWTMVPALDRPR
jgi:hypothetical protein